MNCTCCNYVVLIIVNTHTHPKMPSYSSHQVLLLFLCTLVVINAQRQFPSTKSIWEVVAAPADRAPPKAPPKAPPNDSPFTTTDAAASAVRLNIAKTSVIHEFLRPAETEVPEVPEVPETAYPDDEDVDDGAPMWYGAYDYDEYVNDYVDYYTTRTRGADIWFDYVMEHVYGINRWEPAAAAALLAGEQNTPRKVTPQEYIHYGLRTNMKIRDQICTAGIITMTVCSVLVLFGALVSCYSDWSARRVVNDSLKEPLLKIDELERRVGASLRTVSMAPPPPPAHDNININNKQPAAVDDDGARGAVALGEVLLTQPASSPAVSYV